MWGGDRVMMSWCLSGVRAVGKSIGGLYSGFEYDACVGGTRPGQKGPGFGGCRRRTGTSGRSVGRGVVRRPRGGEDFVNDGCF